ncbi:NADH-quinone oxidoreductase [Komagataeibacter xylinus]|uniref:NADH-quinone oxidoreductase n=1 Tax=Komagataeibacter xylinus TaxID=28448 RepID=A0A857FNI7_KOMXY|nr:NADH-quinone oxidoreductase [Komagataeibacter xylinus]QHC35843.1 NADH-quinone oxidoreductase [Komagataeibacter xylinus]
MSADVVALIRQGTPTPCAGRFVLDVDAWQAMTAGLRDADLPLLGLWADGVQVHALFCHGPTLLVASVGVLPEGYSALSPVRVGAQGPERIIHDLWGIPAIGGRRDPWLDQGRWPVAMPLAAHPVPTPGLPEGREFIDGPMVIQAGGTVLGYGPAEGNFRAPFHLRLGLPGERIDEVQPCMGYAHRGLAARLRGLAPQQAVRLVARIDATATVAHQLAFARALHNATGTAMPAQGVAAGVMLGAMERIATHLDVLAQVSAMLGDGRSATLAATMLEQVRQACRAACGRRLLFDVIPPAAPLPLRVDDTQLAMLAAEHATLHRLFWRPRGLAALARGRGVLSAAMAARWGIVGCNARAAQKGQGDMTDRLDVRLSEIGESLSVLAAPPECSVMKAEGGGGEGLGWAEGPAGPVWHWLRLEAGHVAAWWCGDPSLAQVQALPAILSGAVYEDVGLILVSLGLSATGADL